MNVDLKGLLKMILRDAGAEILERDDEFIWAKTPEGLYLYHIEDKVTVDGDYVVNFIRRTEQVKGYRGIICLKGCKPEAMNPYPNIPISCFFASAISCFDAPFFLAVFNAA
jgi:hypothetical protein